MQYPGDYEIIEKLSTEFLTGSSIGLVALDEELNILSVNDTMLKTFQLDAGAVRGKRFGDVFHCAHMSSDGMLCGTGEECGVCQIRCSLLAAQRENTAVKDKVIDHEFRIGQENVEKRFKFSVKPVRYGDNTYILLSFMDITDIVILEKFLKENEIKYNLLFENMPQGIALHEILTDAKGEPCDFRYLDFNEAFLRLTGLTGRRLAGVAAKDLLPAEEQYIIKDFGRVALTGEPYQYEKYYEEIGKYFDVRVFSPQKGQFATIISDITERVSAENALAESENAFRSYFDNAPDGVLVVDKLGRYIDVNKSACTITGYSREELLSMSVFDITPPEYYEKGATEFQKMLTTGKMYVELPFIRKDHEVRIWSINAVRINENRMISFSTDITEQKGLEKRLKHVYYHDQLTGLYNRQYVFDHLEGIDNEESLPLSLILADINGLRSFNESFGYLVGDKIIREVAEVIQDSCREPAIAVRWGDDDFLLILPNTDEQGAKEFIRELNHHFRNRMIHKSTTISVGMGSYTKTSGSMLLMQAVKCAEETMMEAKALQNESAHNMPINMILRALHEKNNREERHSKRVSELCVLIGRAMGFSQEDIYKLKMIGLVHDIGKIGIDESILNKPDRLTHREYEIMKQHSEIGFRILSANRQTSQLAFYVLSHHERLDGTGYPNGISGSDISLFTRILSVADSYDAMTRERPYCSGISREEAVRELQRFSGTQFDADIVSVFTSEVLKLEPESRE